MKYPYLKNTPLPIGVALALVVLFSFIPLINLIILCFDSLTVGFSKKTLTELGQFGDFFGGHTAAFTGSLSLVVITFFTFHQSKQQEIFFDHQSKQQTEFFEKQVIDSKRQIFIDGITLITQWDITSSGYDQLNN